MILRIVCAVGLAVAGYVEAQTAAPKSILGAVTEFRVDSLQIAVQPDSGAMVVFSVGPETQVVRIPPGERGLDRARPAALADIAVGDRILVSFVTGMAEARRIVLISAGDIAKRNEAERLDWRNRGLSGIVASISGNEITLTGGRAVTLILSEKTVVRRYAPDSVKFTEAKPSRIGEIAPGDQIRARGTKSEDGVRMTADEVVFGTFVTRIGSITAVHRDAREIVIQDSDSKQPVTIRVTADSQLKMLPDLRKMFGAGMPAGGGGAHGPPSGPPDVARTLESLPAGTMDDLKVGTMAIVTSTRGSQTGAVTAIMLLANADALIEMAQALAANSGAKGVSPGEAIVRMHGGAMGGPGGLNLPAMLP